MSSHARIPTPCAATAVLLVLAACPSSAGEGTASTTGSADPTTTEGSTTAPSDTSSSTAPGSTSVTADGTTTSTTAMGTVDSTDGSTGDPPGSDPGCPECTVLVDGLEGGRGLALDATHAYYTDQNRGTVERVALTGGAPEVLAGDQLSPYDVAVDGGHVYWTNFSAAGGVYRMAKAGGEIELIDDYGGPPRSLVVDTTHVYWTSFASGDGGVWRRELALEAISDRLLFAVAGIADLVIDDARVYATSHDPAPNGGGIGFIQEPPMGLAVGVVVSVPLAGDPDFDATTIHASGVAQPWGIAKVGDALFWANGDGAGDNNANAVLSVDVDAGPASVLASGQTAPWGVAADDTTVYWTDFTEIRSMPHGGGDPVVLATMQANARSIAVSDDAVVWITTVRVLLLPKS